MEFSFFVSDKQIVGTIMSINRSFCCIHRRLAFPAYGGNFFTIFQAFMLKYCYRETGSFFAANILFFFFFFCSACLIVFSVNCPLLWCHKIVSLKELIFICEHFLHKTSHILKGFLEHSVYSFPTNV